jgi:PKD repeat protein
MKRISLSLVHLLCFVLLVVGSLNRPASPDARQQQLSSNTGDSNATSGSALLQPSTAELGRLTAVDAQPPNAAQRSQIREAFKQQPLRFEANLGQTDAEVKFLARGLGYSLFLTSNEAVFSFRKDDSEKSETPFRLPPSPARLQPPSSRASQTTLRMRLVGANRTARVSGQDQVAAKTNYFIGSDPKQWRAEVPTYKSVRYAEVYPGIDLVYYGNGEQLEYDFVIAPGASPEAIALNFAGAEQMRVDARGDLVLRTAAGEVRQHKPIIYQERDNKRQPVTGSYVLKDGQQVGFQVGMYDARLPLVIDPTISSYRFVGGFMGDEIGYAIATDRDGNAYLTGFTNSTDFPVTTGAFQPALGNLIGPFPPPVPQGGDAFVAKLDASGNLLYATYLGGNGSDFGQGITVDEAGNAYVVGHTESGNFPVFNGMNLPNGGIILAKFNPNGSVIFSSRINAGGSFTSFPGNFYLNVGLGLDSQGNTYLTGSNNNGTSGNAFIIKVSASGTAILYNTTLSGDLGSQSIAADAAGNAYVTGAISGGPGHQNIFVKKFNPNGAELYSREFGGNGNGTIDFEYGFSIAADANGNAYITGITNSSDFPTMNAIQTVHGGDEDAFLVKLGANGNTLFSTYLGGQDGDRGYGVAADLAGNAYVTGMTRSTNFPVKEAFQETPSNPPAGDIFITKFYPDGKLAFSSYAGGQFREIGYALAIDPFGGNIYITGDAASGDNGGGFDNIIHAALVMKIEGGDTDGDSLLDTWEQQGVTVDAAGNISVGNTGNGEFIDLPGMGANPLHKDIFVHADWMDPLRPQDSAIRRVVEAFDKAPVMNPDRRTGIHLHVDLGPNSLMDNVNKRTWGTRSKAGSVPSVFEIGSFSMGPYDWTQAESYKGLRFDQARRARVFRYCLFANKLTGSRISGIARGIPGTDFLVTLGIGVNTPVGGTRMQQAGTFMHELGHTIGLRHGGSDDIRYKPNYLSAMNYLFQFPGLFKNDLSRELNYSIRRLPTLDETTLNEAVGIQDPDNHHTGWRFPSGSPCSGDMNYFRRLTYPALDWDCGNSLTASTVNVDLRFDMDFPHSTVTKLEGFADWGNLRYDGGGSIGQAGAVPPNPMTTENNEVDVDTLLSLTPQPLRDAENIAPVDDVTYAPLGGNFPLNVTFDGSASIDSDGGTIVSYAWDFGDGSTGAGAVVTHTYTQPGLYYATLKVTDNAGNVNLLPLQNRVEVNCAFTLSPTSQSVGVSGGNQSLNVLTQGGCFWKAASNASWLTIISGHSGTGDGTVSYAVAANPTTEMRTGTLTIAGQMFTVTQEGIICTYTVAPTTFNFSGAGGAGGVDVVTANVCEWSIMIHDDWITLGDGGGETSPTRVNNFGSSTVTFTVAVNNTSSPRTGALTIAGQTVTITQAAPTSSCTYTVSPSSATFSASGGNNSFNVTTQTACNWTPTTTDSWITITSGSGTGNGTVNYSVAAHSSTSNRTGAITLADQTFTVFQGAAFLDVPLNHPFYTEIGKLSARGVTLGCGDGNYCPDQVVTRQQMAAFIIRARGEFAPPTPANQRFDDVLPTSPFYHFIERMAILQITLGCSASPPLYCPASAVSREQMAAFLIRALHEPGYVPTPPAVQRFDDVLPTNPFYAHIEEMALRGITLGCSANPPLYCAGQSVTRAQMAAFLVRAFGL